MNYQQVMDYQRKRLLTLIREVSALNGGDDEAFLEEYIAEVLKEWSDRLYTAIRCFESLKVAEKLHVKLLRQPIWQPVKGHPVFREHYARLERTQDRERLVEEGQGLPSQNLWCATGVIRRSGVNPEGTGQQ